MPSLTPALLASRLAFDWEVVSAMAWPKECTVTGYASMEDIKRGRAATDADGKAGRVTVYAADYRFPMLAGPTGRLHHARIVFNLLAGGSYPFSAPLAQVVSRPLPWSTHIAPGSGVVCLGEGWGKARGKILAAQLVVHCMKCLNTDEPDRGRLYGGYIPEAHRFWREQLGGKPLNDLAYPELPLRLTHGIAVDAAILFEDLGQAAAGGAPLFEEAGQAAGPLFEDIDDGGAGIGFEAIP